METRANYLLVGGFVLALAAGLLVFVLWLAKFQFDVQFNRYDIHYEGSVTGLKIGSPVRYRGVGVGEVIDVGIDALRPERITITVEVGAQTPVRGDTVATLEIEGLTGGLYVLLGETTLESPPLIAQPGQRRPVIAARRSSLQQVLESAPEMVMKVNFLLARASDLLNDDNRAQIMAILANLRGLTDTLAGRGDEIGALVSDAGATMAHLRGAAGALDDLAGTLKTDGTRLVARLDGTLASIDIMASGIDRSVAATAADARALIAENREGIRDFTSAGLSELTVLLIEMRDLVVALNRVTTDIERDPARFFFGNRQQGYEAK